MIRLLIPLLLAAVVSLNLTACGIVNGKGIEAYAGIRSMDEREVKESTKPTLPLKCMFVECGGSHGS